MRENMYTWRLWKAEIDFQYGRNFFKKFLCVHLNVLNFVSCQREELKMYVTYEINSSKYKQFQAIY